MDKKEYFKNYRLKNKEKIKELNKNYREKHSEELNRYSKEYYKNHKDKWEEFSDNKWYYENLIRAKKNRAEYYQKNKEKIKQKRKEHYASDLNAKMSARLRSRFGTELRKYKNGIKNKKESIMDLIGCTVPELIKHIQGQFKPGMTWDNHGSLWHIDHIKPCASFNLTLKEERLQCFHYTNLQPLWVVENLQKGSKYDSA